MHARDKQLEIASLPLRPRGLTTRPQTFSCKPCQHQHRLAVAAARRPVADGRCWASHVAMYWCCWWGTGTCACTGAGGVRRPQHVLTLCFYQVFGAFSWSGIFPIHSAPLASAGVCARFARSSHMVAVGRQSSVVMGPWSIVATTCELE